MKIKSIIVVWLAAISPLTIVAQATKKVQQGTGLTHIAGSSCNFS